MHNLAAASKPQFKAFTDSIRTGTIGGNHRRVLVGRRITEKMNIEKLKIEKKMKNSRSISHFFMRTTNLRQ